MNAVDSHQQFKYEFIVGTSLSNNLHRSNQSNLHANVAKENRTFATTYNAKQTPLTTASIVEQAGVKQLEIIGFELRTNKSSSNTHDYQLENRHGRSSLNRQFTLTRIDQTMFQLPRRTTFTHGRSMHEHTLSRTFTNQVPFVSNLTISDKPASISSDHQVSKSIQNSDDKLPMPQRTQSNLTLHPSITVLKKLSITHTQLSPRSISKRSQQTIGSLGRESTSFKLPTLLKRTPATIVKPIPSAYIQETSQLKIPPSSFANRAVLQPTPVLPIFTPHRSLTLYAEQKHFPSLKDHMVKANLSQKANFKCKSPLLRRPDSSLSRSTSAMVTSTQLNSKTYTPLKHMDVGLLLDEATRNRLKKLFYQLDTDQDGHLTYPQVQKCLPPTLSRPQETFFRVLYDITSDSTYFGLQEFYATAVLLNMIAQQDQELWTLLLDDVDFNYYRSDILELLDAFDSHYSPVTSTIKFDNLVSLIMNRTTNGKYDRIAQELEHHIPLIKTMKLTRLEFIALIPLIIYIESSLDHGKTLFRFRENSILNLHMKKALLT